MSKTPEIQIERVPVLKQSMIRTLEEQGFTVSDEKFDIADGGQRSRTVYHFGEIVKRIIYEGDETFLK